MTTSAPPCVNPFQPEIIRVIETSNNTGLIVRDYDEYANSSRSFVSNKSSEGNSISVRVRALSSKRLKDNIIKYKQILDSFLELPEGWDTYDAIPPNSSVIHKSHQILNSLNDFKGFVNIVYPLNEGVQIDFHSKNNKYEIEVFEDKINLVQYDNDDEYLAEIEFDNNSMFSLNDYII